MFPVDIWSMHQRVQQGLPRTNNSVEAWHCSFQASIQCSHPTLWKLIDALKREQGLQQSVLAQVTAGKNPLRRKRHYLRVDKGLTTLIERAESIPTLDFLRGCAHNIEMNV
jgi:hypothetical protein